MRAFALLLVTLLLLAPVAAARAERVDLPPGWRTPSALAFAPDGALWVALEGSWALGRWAANGSESQLFPLPPASGKGALWGLLVTPEGVVWASSGEALYRVGVNGTEAFPFPVRAQLPGDVVLDREGHVWVALTDADALLELDPASGNYTRVDVAPDTGPLGFADLGGGLVAFTATYANTLGVLDTTARRVTMRSVPLAGPVGIAASEDAMWVGEMGASSFARVSNDGVAHYFTTPSPFYPISGPTGVLVARDGGIWFAEHFADRVARFDPADETLAEYPLPGEPGANVQRVAEGPDGRVWATLTSHDQLAIVTHDAGEAPDVPRALNGTAGGMVRLPAEESLEVVADPSIAVSRAADAAELYLEEPGSSKVLVSRTLDGAKVGRYATLDVAEGASPTPTPTPKDAPGPALAALLVVLALAALGRRRA